MLGAVWGVGVRGTVVVRGNVVVTGAVIVRGRGVVVVRGDDGLAQTEIQRRGEVGAEKGCDGWFDDVIVRGVDAFVVGEAAAAAKDEFAFVGVGGGGGGKGPLDHVILTPGGGRPFLGGEDVRVVEFKVQGCCLCLRWEQRADLSSNRNNKVAHMWEEMGGIPIRGEEELAGEDPAAGGGHLPLPLAVATRKNRGDGCHGRVGLEVELGRGKPGD